MMELRNLNIKLKLFKANGSGTYKFICTPLKGKNRGGWWRMGCESNG